jgi:cell division protease FtsH
LGKEIHEPRDFGEGTANLIDDEVRRILREADEHAFNLLKSNRHLMDRLVEALLQKEELLREELDEILKGDGSNGLVMTPDTGDAAEKVESRNGG